MNIKKILNKKLSYKEMNDTLNELMGYSCNIPEDSSVVFCVYDEDGKLFDFRKYIGMRALNTISVILLLKEKIDEERGEYIGMVSIQRNIKKALDIK